MGQRRKTEGFVVNVLLRFLFSLSLPLCSSGSCCLVRRAVGALFPGGADGPGPNPLTGVFCRPGLCPDAVSSTSLPLLPSTLHFPSLPMVSSFSTVIHTCISLSLSLFQCGVCCLLDSGI